MQMNACLLCSSVQKCCSASIAAEGTEAAREGSVLPSSSPCPKKATNKPKPYLLGGPCLVKQKVWELKIRKSLFSTCCRRECWACEQRRPPSCGPVDLLQELPAHVQIGFSTQHIHLGGRDGYRHSHVEALWPKVEGAGFLLHLCIWAESAARETTDQHVCSVSVLPTLLMGPLHCQAAHRRMGLDLPVPF